MNKQIKNRIITSMTLITLVILLIPFANSQYTDTKDVITRVNITNAMPEIQNVLVDDPITLTGGGYKIVTCNTTIRDWNGWDDIDLVNATLYHTINSTHDSEDNLDEHYTNNSCANTGNDGQYITEYSCSFNVVYHANNGGWTCNVTTDDGNFTDSLSNTTTINELYALNVTDVIDYGELAVMDDSLEIPAIITNLGNMEINISVEGYGATPGDGIGLICGVGDNISVEYQRFSLELSNYDLKTPLSSTTQDMGLTLPKPLWNTAPVSNETYWQLRVPPNPFGLCEGNLQFTAYAP